MYFQNFTHTHTDIYIKKKQRIDQILFKRNSSLVIGSHGDDLTYPTKLINF